MSQLKPTMLILALASCGAIENAAQGGRKGGAAVEHATNTKLNINSDAFKDGQRIPVDYSCDGKERTPVLRWGAPPSGTKSFALVVDDPDAPNGTFRHWGVYDIPASARALGGNQRVGTEVSNDFGKVGYGGPCPPKGHGPHHYHFKLFALDVEQLDVGSGAKVADVEQAASRHVIGQGELVGIYERR
jgi:Raf kinase inhibitor-like YbhB/YbcL family protein